MGTFPRACIPLVSRRSTNRPRRATILERYTLEIALRRVLLDLATRRRAAGERDLSDLHMACHQLSGLAAAVDDVDDAGWETLLDQLAERQSAKGRLLRGLVDERVAGGEGGLDGSSAYTVGT